MKFTAEILIQPFRNIKCAFLFVRFSHSSWVNILNWKSQFLIQFWFHLTEHVFFMATIFFVKKKLLLFLNCYLNFYQFYFRTGKHMGYQINNKMWLGKIRLWYWFHSIVLDQSFNLVFPFSHLSNGINYSNHHSCMSFIWLK